MTFSMSLIFLGTHPKCFCDFKEYCNDTYYVHSPKGTRTVRYLCVPIHVAVLNSRQTQMTSWMVQPLTPSLCGRVGKSSVHWDQTNNIN